MSINSFFIKSALIFALSLFAAYRYDLWSIARSNQLEQIQINQQLLGYEKNALAAISQLKIADAKTTELIKRYHAASDINHRQQLFLEITQSLPTDTIDPNNLLQRKTLDEYLGALNRWQIAHSEFEKRN